jgi:diaminopimelate decarboxylase
MRTHEAGVLHADVTQSGSRFGAPPSDLAALAPGLWPVGAARVGGAVTVAGVDVRVLAAEFGTPAYLVDEDDFRGRCRAWQAAFGAAFGDAEVFYAAKAFLSTATARWVEQEGLSIDVCSSGELAVALRAGMPPQRIALHGNNKSLAELEWAVTAGVGTVVLDSLTEITRLAAIAGRHGVRQRVMVRATVGVEAHTHEFIATAHEDQKFGFSLSSGVAAAAARQVLALPELELVGLHSHIGSQIFDTNGFEVAARRLVGLHAELRDEHGVELPELGLGGGLGIAYVTGDDPQEPADIARQLSAIVRRECAAAGTRVPRVSVEPGRAIAGPGTVTLYEVGTVKDVDGIRTYVSVDGGMSDNIRTALYDASYTCVLASRESTAPAMLSRVVGRHCESGDIVVRDAWLPADLRPGDLLLVAATGAYCRSMASNYNHVPRPPVVAVRAGAARLLVRRETEEDLYRLDVTDEMGE